MKVKTEKGKEYSALPKFHVYFPLSRVISNANEIRDLKEMNDIKKIIDDFDSNECQKEEAIKFKEKLAFTF